MKRILGIQTRKKQPPPGIDETIDVVDKKAENIDKKINQCDNELRKIQGQMKLMGEGGAKNVLREKCKRILTRRKQYEQMSSTLHQQSFNMEQATSTLQAAKTNQQIFAAMKDGAKEMKKVYKNLKIEDVDAFQDEMEDIYETSEEIQASLCRNYNTPEDIDEAQLEAELEALGDEIIADNDTAYLDQATQSPGIPKDGGSIPVPENPQPAQTVQPRTNTDGIAVDEYGLPIVQVEESSQNK